MRPTKLSATSNYRNCAPTIVNWQILLASFGNALPPHLVLDSHRSLGHLAVVCDHTVLDQPTQWLSS
jgi:hypothetical protein